MADQSEFDVQRSEEEWAAMLTADQFDVLRGKRTEAAFTGEYVYNKAPGSYVCRGCGIALFVSETKYESHTGWATFTEPAVPANVATHHDDSFGMQRVALTCTRCGGHLGHLFDDGPPPTGLRYSVNSSSLGFEPVPSIGPATPEAPAPDIGAKSAQPPALGAVTRRAAPNAPAPTAPTDSGSGGPAEP